MRDSLLTRLVVAGLAGLAATAPMSAVMHYLYENLPFWERYSLPPYRVVGRVLRQLGLRHANRHHHTSLTWGAHFSYGTAMGALYAPFEARVAGAGPYKGLVYGFLVWVFNYVGLLPSANILPSANQHPQRRNLLMIASHLVWGAVLGLLFDAGKQLME